MDGSLKIIKGRLEEIPADKAKNLLDKLASTSAADPSVGIFLSKVRWIAPVAHDGMSYDFYVARVMPGKYVMAHYHRRGAEPYFFLSGFVGQMNLGRVNGEQVLWEPVKLVEPNDLFTVKDNQVHCFYNGGNVPYDFAFACPKEHLLDNSPEQPNGDRYITNELINGLPF